MKTKIQQKEFDHRKAQRDLLEAARDLAFENLISDGKIDPDWERAGDLALIEEATADILHNITRRLVVDASPGAQARRFAKKRKEAKAKLRGSR